MPLMFLLLLLALIILLVYRRCVPMLVFVGCRRQRNPGGYWKPLPRRTYNIHGSYPDPKYTEELNINIE